MSYPGRRDLFFASRGYIQIDSNRVRVLAEICEPKNKIDAERAARARERAEKRLKEMADVDWSRAEAALKRALARLEIANMS